MRQEEIEMELAKHTDTILRDIQEVNNSRLKSRA